MNIGASLCFRRQAVYKRNTESRLFDMNQTIKATAIYERVKSLEKR
jgi:hypothetical protein